MVGDARGTIPFVETVLEEVEVGPWTLAIEHPPDATELIDEEAFARDEFLPYWAELWPAGVALAQLVAERELAGVRVLELGCGLGLPSIADALALLERNAARNGAALRTWLLDWRDPSATARADLVLASDVLYEQRYAELLVAVLERVAPREVLVADPGRSYARPFLDAARERWTVEPLVERSEPRLTVVSLRARGCALK